MKKIERLLNLVSFFYSQKKPVNLDEINQRLLGYQNKSPDALRQMFHRDKKELEKFGITIEYKGNLPEEERGFIIPYEKRYLPQISFTTNEIASLKTLHSFLEKQEGYPFQDELKNALLKISLNIPALLHENIKDIRKEMPIYFDLTTRFSELVKTYITLLEEAIENKREIKMDYYYVRKGECAERKVFPYHIFFMEGSWYLIGFCLLHKQVRTYKVERMRNVKVRKSKKDIPDYEIPEDFNPEKYYSLKPWEFEKDKSIDVKIKLSPKVSPWAKRLFRKVKKERKFKNGYLELTVVITSIEAFLMWALTMGRDVRILAPKHIRENLVDILKEIENKYKKNA
ncbi:MAG: WYL domain-containing protein [Actinomycetia bacterium]|nr:WYL domain-containing protein [Actinomycetes bacterium]